MELRKRTLRFYCGSCDDSESQTPTIVGQILDNINPILDAKLKKISEQNEVLINSLKQQVTALTASNKDLIKLLNPVVPGTSGREATRGSSEAERPLVKKQASVGRQTIPPEPLLKVSHTGSKVSSPPKPRIEAPREHRGDVIRGTVQIPATACGPDTFAAVARRAHLYVGKVRPDVSKETVAKYVRERAPNTNFDLEELPKREEAASRAFKMTTDFAWLDTFNRPDFWPQDVVVKRFFLPKKKPQQWSGGK